MWNKLQNTDYFLSFTDNLEVCVTNFVKIWSKSFSESGFLDRLKDSNQGLEIDENEVKTAKTILAQPDHLKREQTTVSEYRDTLNLHLLGDKVKIGFPLHLKLELQEGSKELFFEKVTQPLLQTVQDLRASEQELIRLLQKKDKEIEEYKCEGGKIALRHLKTIPFNDLTHQEKYQSFTKYFGNTEIPESLLAKTFSKTEPVKPDPDSCTPKIPSPVKVEVNHNIDVKQEVKVETSSQSISIESQRRKQKRKLNI